MPNASRTSTDIVDELEAALRQERPDLSPEAIALSCRLIYVGRKMEARAAQILRPFNLNYTELDVLGTLRREGRPFELSVAALMRSAMITSGAMTACLNRLEKRGLIGRRVDREDRRVRRVRLTDDGFALIDAALTVRFGDAVRLFDGMTSHEVADLLDVLRRLGATYDPD